MSSPVDVVRLMNEVERVLLEDGFVSTPRELAEARAAVENLIEKAEEALYTIGYYAELLDSERGSGHSIERLANDGEEPEYVSLRAAISRVKGEQA